MTLMISDNKVWEKGTTKMALTWSKIVFLLAKIKPNTCKIKKKFSLVFVLGVVDV